VTALIHSFGAHLALLVSGAVAGGVVQGISGFAFGMTAMSIGALLVPLLLGVKVYRRLSDDGFRRTLLLLLTLSGLVLIASALPFVSKRA
jgi:hypothetical protein